MMKKYTLILFLLLGVFTPSVPATAQTPAQLMQYAVAPIFNLMEQPVKAAHNLLVQAGKALNQAKERIQQLRQTYISATSVVSAPLEWAQQQLGLSVGQDLNATRVNDEAQGARELDEVPARVRTNMNSNFQNETQGGAEAENEQIEKRKQRRQVNNIDKLARVLVLKYKLSKIAESLKEAETALQSALQEANAGTSSMEKALKENVKLRVIWYNLLAVQMEIETYNLDAKASQGLASMMNVAMEMEYDDEYLLKISQ